MKGSVWIASWISGAACLTAAAATASPTLEITEKCHELVPLYEALPANECFVTSMVRRESDDRVIGATCGKKRICLFSFDHPTAAVKRLDCFEALWWDEPRVALGPNGDIFLGARRVHDKQFVFERLRERPQTPGAKYQRRDVVPGPHEVNERAAGMPIRHYSAQGRLLAEIPLPASLAEDGVGALVVCAEGKMLCGLSAPGGRLFTISLETGAGKDLGEVVRFPNHHQTRRISRVLMPGDDGIVYFCGSMPDAKAQGEHGDDDIMGFILGFDPRTGKLVPLEARVPAVIGRRRLAAVDAAVKLDDGSFLGGTSDGYLFRFDPKAGSVEAFGKPLRQHNICGLARGADGLVYGAGGEPGGLPRLFAFDPQTGQLHLGTSPTGTPPGGTPSLFGEIGALVTTSDGTLICGERERRGYLLLYRSAEQRLPWRTVFEGKAFAQCTRDRFTDLAEDGSGVRLAPTFLISDTMARSAKVRQTLGDKVFAKKVFTLDRPCREAEILFYGGGGTPEEPMLIRVNRNEILHVKNKDRMRTGGWDRETLPGALLFHGKNELVFGQAGTLLVDTDASGENSFKATAKWGPWKSGVLGPHGNLAGEYVVRIRIHGHPSTGTITSPILDLAAAAAGKDTSTVPPIVRVDRVRLSFEAGTPPRTSVRLEVRSGTTPDYTPANWSGWSAADAVTGDRPRYRFLQWRAVLASRDANRTPVLRKVIVEASGETAGVNRKHIQVKTAPDNAIAVSSYAFDYADPQQPRMRHLREKYKLEQVVAPGRTEAEKFALLRQWVREQWEGWNKNKYNYCPQWDALEILELAPANLSLGMCTHYAAVFTECAAALGYHARELIVDHHCLAEVWSDQYGKWILQDPGLLPGHAVAFQYEHDGTPINALEMHQRAVAGSAEDIRVVPDPPVPLEQMRKQMVRLYVRFGIPLRNDHLYRPEPQELEHGMGQYHWDGYLWWTDELDPQYPEYSLLTNRPEDLYWTLNKTRITLEDTESAGMVSVRLSGPIPNLAGFRVRTDDGKWTSSAPAFAWTLHSGKNILQAKAVNTMGVEGPVNQAALEYAPH